MNEPAPSSNRVILELRRRRVFRTAGLYIVGAWVVMQVADVLFPGWGIPDSALRYLLYAAVLGFPVALVFGWRYDIGPDGIRRTGSAGPGELKGATKLHRGDYVLLAALAAVLGAIAFEATRNVLDIAGEPDPDAPIRVEKADHSIAVLPFASMSPDPEDRYFCDGIAEEILNRLAAIDELHVIARTSSFSLRDGALDVPKMSALLGVQYLLQGSVRRAGDRLRISTQLIDEGGRQVWGTSFDRRLEDVFDIQSEVADAVVASVAPKVAPPTSDRREPDPEAHAQFLIGRAIARDRATGWGEQAPPYLREAIAIDPEYAEAYAELAIVLMLNRFHLPGRKPAEVLAEAQMLIDKALDLDPDLPRALAGKGLHLGLTRPEDYAERERYQRRALELDPNDVEAMNWLSNVLSAQGRPEKGLLERAARLDPLEPWINVNLAMRYWSEGDAVAAERIFRRLVQVPAPSLLAFYDLGRFYLQTGRIVDAYEVGKDWALDSVRRTGLPITATLIEALSAARLFEEVNYWMARGAREYATMPVAQISIARFLLEQGRFEEAREVFEALLAGGLGVEYLPPGAGADYALALAVTGEMRQAKDMLSAMVGAGNPAAGDRVAAQTLSWVRFQLAEEDAALELLESVDAYFVQRDASGRMGRSGDWVTHARNAAIGGDLSTAQQRLERAVELGFVEIEPLLHDPRWGALVETPGFTRLLDEIRVKTEAARQEILRREKEQPFQNLIDDAIRNFRAQSQTPASG